MNGKLLIEAFVVGVLSSALSRYVPGAFLLGFILHIICELTGVNKWYCRNGNACKKPSKSALKTNNQSVTPEPKSVTFGTPVAKNTEGKILQTIQNVPIVGPVLEPLAEIVLAVKIALFG
tara:strand:- start:142 stop:501 length:360 start_codon:yes stop_codon:yes gene_type:complete